MVICNFSDEIATTSLSVRFNHETDTLNLVTYVRNKRLACISLRRDEAKELANFINNRLTEQESQLSPF